MWLTLAAALTIGQVPDARPLSPADAVTAAAQFVAKLPPGYDARHIRFLSLYNLDAKDRPLAVKVLSGHANALSRQAKLTPVGVVPNTNNSLVWIDLRAYRWSVELWEKLAPLYFSALVEEYELVTVWPAVPAGGMYPGNRPWTDGKTYGTAFKVADAYPAVVEKRQKHVVQKAAPWLPEAAVNALGAATYSRNPIVRADWFVHRTSVQRKNEVGLYDFYGIKNQKDYETLVRFDDVLARETEHRRIVIFSGILNESATPRRIEQKSTVLGKLWRSFDSEIGQDKKNALRVLDGELEFEATEQIAPMINGMPAFLLANSKGVLQNAAPTNIVGADWTAHGNDKQLLNGKACWTCHWGADKKEMGIKDFKFARVQKLKALDYDRFEELVRQYLRDVAPDMASQRLQYEAAIKEATVGLSGFEYANGLGKMFAAYEAPRTPELFARELGVTKDAMLKAFKGYNDATDALDPVLSLLLAGDAIPYRSAEEAYVLGQNVLNSVRFGNAVKPGKN